MDIKVQGFTLGKNKQTQLGDVPPKVVITSGEVPTSIEDSVVSKVDPIEEAAEELKAEEEFAETSGVSENDPKYEAFKKASLWLRDTLFNPERHIRNIVVGALQQGSNAVTGIHRYEGKIGGVLNKIIFAMGAAVPMVEELIDGSLGSLSITSSLNAIFDEMKNPNIEGIPIHADVEKEVSEVQVAKNLYIRETASNKQYAIDNTVPQPRTWQISGYLMSNPHASSFNANLLIKPDLVLQRKLLQLYIDTRKPVVFKTHDNRFFYVLITHFESSYTTQALNALQVNLTLTEFNVMQVDYTSQAVVVAKKGGVEL